VNCKNEIVHKIAQHPETANLCWPYKLMSAFSHSGCPHYDAHPITVEIPTVETCKEPTQR